MNINAAALAYLGLGLTILALGVHLCRQQKAYEANSKLAEGIVKEILTTRMQDSSLKNAQYSTYFSPVVEFRADNGAVLTHRSNDYVSPNPYVLGMQVEIRYDPANPANSQLNNGFLNWLGPVAISIVGSVFLLLGTLATFGVLRTEVG